MRGELSHIRGQVGTALWDLPQKVGARIEGLSSARVEDGSEIDVFGVSVAPEPEGKLIHVDTVIRALDRAGIIRIDTSHPANQPQPRPQPILETYGGTRKKNGRWLIQLAFLEA